MDINLHNLYDKIYILVANYPELINQYNIVIHEDEQQAEIMNSWRKSDKFNIRLHSWLVRKLENMQLLERKQMRLF